MGKPTKSFKEVYENIILEAKFKDKLPQSGQYPYIPPKKFTYDNPKKAKEIKKGDAYQDKKGNIWVADNLHGGPHWDVQDKHSNGYTRVNFEGEILEISSVKVFTNLILEGIVTEDDSDELMSKVKKK